MTRTVCSVLESKTVLWDKCWKSEREVQHKLHTDSGRSMCWPWPFSTALGLSERVCSHMKRWWKYILSTDLVVSLSHRCTQTFNMFCFHSWFYTGVAVVTQSGSLKTCCLERFFLFYSIYSTNYSSFSSQDTKQRAFCFGLQVIIKRNVSNMFKFIIVTAHQQDHFCGHHCCYRWSLNIQPELN